MWRNSFLGSDVHETPRLFHRAGSFCLKIEIQGASKRGLFPFSFDEIIFCLKNIEVVVT
jgi:hypothetical protein